MADLHSPEHSYSIRLYLAHQTQVPSQAIEYLRMACEKHLPGPANVEVIDLSKEPGRIQQDGVIATPMLVKLSPPPIQKIVGNFGEMYKITQILGISGDTSWRNGGDFKL